jgi:23S rRNA (uracil1939-C5)-methyltransferase
VAKALAKMLHQNQLSYVAGDLLKTLPRHVGFMRERDVVLLDPPRSGVHREVLRLIVSARPKTLVYLSCNPAKLGRDLSMLLSSGFRLEEIQPYDFFPQTASLEVLCILKRTG